jgi:hypothetical protein
MFDSESTTAPRLPAELLQPWSDFLADPGDGTAERLAQALDTLRAANAELAASAMRIIAAELARRTARDRCGMSLLLTFWLTDSIGFLQATAGVNLADSTMERPKRDKTAEHLDPARATGRAPSEPLAAEPAPPPKPGKVHRRVLEGLDLAAADGHPVDIAELERRINDANDATSLRHLGETLSLLESIVIEGVGYSEARRRELASTAGTTQGHMARQMGFRAAPSCAPKSVRGALGTLDAQNATAASYWRTNFHERLGEFLRHLPTLAPPTPGQCLVNSPTVLNKLAIVLPPEALKGITVKALRGETGISLLSGMRLDVEPKPGEVVLTPEILHEMGASPSAYQLYELFDEGKTEPSIEYWIDTHAALARLITGSRFSRLQEIAAGKSNLAPVCAMVEQLILALTDGWGPARHDALTASALASLTDLIDLVVVSVEVPSVALRAIDLMIDEIGVIVAVARNYLGSDYAAAMRAILIERAPSIKGRLDVDIEVGSHLVSSGMDALATALWVALSTRGHQQVTRPTEPADYFETDLLLGKLKRGETVTPRKDVLVAALNPSTPWTAPDAEQLARDVLAGLATRATDDPPFALILDTTIQTAAGAGERSQLDVVLGALSGAIAAGGLEVFLCKSLQKYATFGFGKVAAGDLTLLSKKGNRASAATCYEVLREEFALDLTRHDEAQLVVHILKHAHRHELALIAVAAAGTRFVDRFCWPVDGKEAFGTPYVDGIPLLLRATVGDLNAVVKKFPALDARNSFSFLRTSWVGDINLKREQVGREVKYVRFNTGHESRAGMVEIFYALGHLATGLLPGHLKPTASPIDPDQLSIQDVEPHLRALADSMEPSAGGKAISKAAAELWRYRNNITASYCLCMSVLIRGKLEGKLPVLVDFFNEYIDGVTPDTLRILAQALLTLARKQGGVCNGTPLLTAVSRAAATLPPWQFPAEALAIDLSQAGDTQSARRLRKLVKRAKEVAESKARLGRSATS